MWAAQTHWRATSQQLTKLKWTYTIMFSMSTTVNNQSSSYTVMFSMSTTVNNQFSPVQSLSRVRLFATPWTSARQASLSITNFPVKPNPCPLSPWCHPTISSSVVPFSSWLQSLPASESFPMSQLFTWGGQSTGVSASTSVPPMNTQDWSPLRWTGWIFLQSRDSQESSPTPQFKSINSLVLSLL